MEPSANLPTDASPPGTPHTPCFSIIMNVFNGASFLRPALESVLAQSFTDWELIFWDDQSTDDSAAVLGEYPDPRIRYFYAPAPASLAEARNQAIRRARAPWLAFIDQDDVWSPDKLEAQHRLIEQDHGAGTLGMVYGRAMKFDRRGRIWDADHRHEFGKLPEGNLFRELIVRSCFIAMSSVVLRRSALEDVAGGGVPLEYRHCPDYYLYLAIARRYRAACLQKTCCWYRIHPRSLSASSVIPIHQEAIRIVEAFAGDIEPRTLRRRRQVHQTLIGITEIRARHTFRTGLERILRQGSLTYLLSRPFARGGRALRRILRRRPGALAPTWPESQTA